MYHLSGCICQLLVISFQSSVIMFQLLCYSVIDMSVTSHQLSVLSSHFFSSIIYELCVISYHFQLSSIGYQLSGIKCHRWGFSRLCVFFFFLDMSVISHRLWVISSHFFQYHLWDMSSAIIFSYHLSGIICVLFFSLQAIRKVSNEDTAICMYVYLFIYVMCECKQ